MLPLAGTLARFLLKSQLLTVFLVLCVLGFFVGAQTRPDPHAVPYAELFDQLSVFSFRDTPADTGAHFVVELAAGGKVFSRYDVESRQFLPPERGRAYSRIITGTHYAPLRVRGHVGDGFWLQVPNAAGRSLLPEQFAELYRTTLDFVKPVSILTSALGILTGYSVGYRLGTWQGSLSNHAVQERVLATPGLGRTIAREGWRRVLLEPVVMADEDDAARFAAVQGTHRLYANFFRLALNDSDGFIPREAERLAGLGRTSEAQAMLGFLAAVRHAAEDSVHLGSADFAAVERWASLLDRRGHWAQAAIPPPGEQRVRYLGTLAWYGLAPPSDVDRVWVGPRMLVRTGDTRGFVADEIPNTGVGSPIAWRERLHEERTGTNAMANAWLSDRPEFVALATFGRRTGGATMATARRLFAGSAGMAQRAFARPAATPRSASKPAGAAPVSYSPGTAPVRDAEDPDAPRRSIRHPFQAMGTTGSIILVGSDSVATAASARAARAAFQHVDSLMSNWTTTSEVARVNRDAASGPAPMSDELTSVVAAGLRTWRASDGAFDITVEPLVRAWGFIGGPRRVPTKAEAESAQALVGSARMLAFDSLAHTIRFDRPGVRIDLGGIAKGYAVDVAAESLLARGVRDALVDISGNMFALGAPAHAERWRIGIRDPRDRVPYFARLLLSSGEGISTSGKYEQFVAANGKTYGHIMDPRTGRPADGLISVTVIARRAMEADAWSTALFVLGPAEARRKARERDDLSAILVVPGDDGIDTVWVESSLRDRFALENDGRTLFRVEYY